MNSRRLLYWMTATGIAVAMAGYALWPSEREGDEAVTRYIAYIGRYTNHQDTIPIEQQEKGKFDMLHDIVLRDYVRQLDEELPTIDLKLKTFDNHRDPRVSDSLYRNVISRDSSIVMVIDNTWGVHLQPSAPTIRTGNIPLIAMNADRGGFDFGSAAIFTGNDDDVPLDIAQYLARVMKTGSVILLSERDYPLHGTFISTMQQQGITIDSTFTVIGSEATKDSARRALLSSLFGYYRSHPEAVKVPLVMNTHSPWGELILNEIDRTLEGVTVIGGAYISTIDVTAGFGRGSSNELIIMSRPTDAISRPILADLDRFKRGDPIYFDAPTAPYFIKRCQSVAEIIRHVLTRRPDSLPLERQDVADGFRSLRGSLVTGQHDLYQFDSTLVLTKETYFTQHREGKFYSLPQQLNARRDVIPNVLFGVDIIDIYDLDVSNNTFKADFFYWTKLDTAQRDAEKYILFQNMKATESSRELVIEKIEGDLLYRLHKVSGTFHNRYNLRDFPLDEQEISIQAEILNPSDELKISFDQTSLDIDSTVLDRFVVTAWEKDRYFTAIDNHISTAMHGDPERIAGRPAIFKSFSFNLKLRRKFAGPFLEIVLPLVLIGFVAIALLYVKDISFENLGEVSVGTFLGIITFSIALSVLSPSSDSLTRADLLFWITFMVVLISFMTIIVVNARYKMGELEGVSIRPVSYFLTVAYPLAVVGVLVV
jgi:hypothetical protein